MSWRSVGSTTWGRDNLVGTAVCIFPFQNTLIAMVRPTDHAVEYTFFRYVELSEGDGTYEWNDYSSKIQPLQRFLSDVSNTNEGPIPVKHSIRSVLFDTTAEGLASAAKRFRGQLPQTSLVNPDQLALDFPDLYMVVSNDGMVYVAKYDVIYSSYRWGNLNAVTRVPANTITNPGGFGIDPATKSPSDPTQYAGFMGAAARLSNLHIYGNKIYLSHWGGLSRLSTLVTPNQFEQVIDLSQEESTGYTTGLFTYPADNKLYVAVSASGASNLRSIYSFSISNADATSGENPAIDDSAFRVWTRVVDVPAAADEIIAVKDIFLSNAIDGILVGIENVKRNNAYVFDPVSGKGMLEVTGSDYPILSNGHQLPGAVSGVAYYDSTAANLITVSSRYFEDIDADLVPTESVQNVTSTYVKDSFISGYVMSGGNKLLSGTIKTALNATLPVSWTSTPVRPTSTNATIDNLYKTSFNGLSASGVQFLPTYRQSQALYNPMWLAKIATLTAFDGQIFSVPNLRTTFTPGVGSDYTFTVTFASQAPYQPSYLAEYYSSTRNYNPLVNISGVSVGRNVVYAQLVASYRGGITDTALLAGSKMDTSTTSAGTIPIIGKSLLFNSAPIPSTAVVASTSASRTVSYNDNWRLGGLIEVIGNAKDPGGYYFTSTNEFKYTLTADIIEKLLANKSSREMDITLIFSMYLGDHVDSAYPSPPTWSSSLLGVYSIEVTEDNSPVTVNLSADSLVKVIDDVESAKKTLFIHETPEPDYWYSVFDTKSGERQTKIHNAISDTPVHITGGLLSNEFTVKAGVSYNIGYGVRWDAANAASATNYPLNVIASLITPSGVTVFSHTSQIPKNTSGSSTVLYGTAFNKVIYPGSDVDQILKLQVIFDYPVVRVVDPYFGNTYNYDKVVLLSDLSFYEDATKEFNDVYVGNSAYYISTGMDVSILPDDGSTPTFSHPISPTVVHNLHSITGSRDYSVYALALDEVYYWDASNRGTSRIIEEE